MRPHPAARAALGVFLAVTRTLLVVLSALVGSGTVAHAVPAQAAIEPAETTAIGGEALRFDSEDGVHLAGYLFRPAKGQVVKGAIVFVHEPARSGRDWAYLADKMTRFGFVSLVFDLRGHGDSLKRGDVALDRELFGPEDFAAMVSDVKAAVAQVRTAVPGGTRLHLAGADLGGSLALLYANGDPGVADLAVLSPGLGYDGVNLMGQIPAFGSRPALLVFSMEDGYARKSTEVMDKELRGPHHVETYYGVGHGTKMMAREPKLEGLLVSWFLGTLITSEGRELADTGKPTSGEKAMEGAELDATGEKKRLEQQKKDAEKAKKKAVEDDEDKKKRWQE
jgi:pimeloyl-ACP methyl ester carboxylesterase